MDNANMEVDDAGKEIEKEAATHESGTKEAVVGQTKMGYVMSQILNSGKSVKKGIFVKIDEELLEERALKLIALEKRKKADVARVIPEVYTNEYEKRLRKVATRGVVKLFNAVRVAQKSVQDSKKTENASIVAKEGFMKVINKSEPENVADIPEKKKEVVSWISDNFMMNNDKAWDLDSD